ncbi:MAG TPA: hypothetical protein PKD55_02420 [Bellilinea sp.]|nr:hypothetical protein [Bellilinea sp.]
MALQAKLGSFNTGTGAVGSTVVISGLGFQPKYCFFWYTGSASSIDEIARGDARMGFGAFDASSTQRFVAAVIQDNLATSNTASSRDSDGVIALAGPAIGIMGKLTLQSIDVDGFTLSVSTQMAADLRVHYLALGGPELLVKIGTLTLATGATGNQSVTGLTFQPTMVHLWGGFQTAINIGGAPLFFGSMMSGAKQAAGAWNSRDGRPSAEARRYLYNGEALAVINATNALDVQAGYVSMNADGFTVNVTNSPGNTLTSWYTAFGGVDMDMGVLLTQQDTTTDITVSGLGFRPAAGLIVSAGITQPTQGSPFNYLTFSMGAFTDAEQRTMSARDNQGADPTSTMYGIEHDAVYQSLSVTGDVVNAQMHVTSVNSDGFTARMTDAEDVAQAQALWIVWGNVVGAGPQTITVPDLTTAEAWGVPRLRSEVVTVDLSTSHQTLRGGLSVKGGLYQANRERPQGATVNGEPVATAYANALDQISDLLIDAGVFQMRVEVEPYVMHSHSYFADWLADNTGTFPLSDYTSDFIEGVGYSWDSVDYIVNTAFIPLRDRMRLQGRTLKFQLCFVNFRLSSEPSTLNQKMFDDATRWATLIKDTYVHLRDTYGLIPDTYDVLLEPNTNVEGAAATATQIAAGMQAMVTQLAAEGITPHFIVPSDVTTLGSYNIWNSLRSILGDSFCSTYVTEISYHRYGSPSLAHIQSFASQADALGIGAAMTEFIGADIDALIEDLTEGKNTTWEQFAVINTTPDSGGTLIIIDDTLPASPVVSHASRTRLLRQVFHYAHPGSVRGVASATTVDLKPVAFVTEHGQVVAAVRATGEKDFWISGLPDGTYRLEYATTGGPVSAGSAVVSGGNKIATYIPAAGVLTVYEAGVYPYSIFTEDEWGLPAITTQPGQNTATLDETLDDLTVAALAETPVGAALSETLDDLAISANAETPTIGQLDAALDGLTVQASAEVSIGASLAEALDDLVSTGTAETLITGLLAETLDDLSVSGSADIAITGQLSEVLDDLTASAFAEVKITGTLSETLSLNASGQAAVSISGNLSETLDDLTVTASGVVGEPPIIATLSATLDDMTASAIASVDISGQLGETLEDITISGVGNVAIEGVILGTLDLDASGQAEIAITGTLSETLDLSGTGYADVSISGALTETLEDVGLSSYATVFDPNLIIPVADLTLNARSTDLTLPERSVELTLPDRSADLGVLGR